MSEVKERNILVWVLLSIVTCGICGIVWFFYMNTDVKNITKDEWFSGGKNFILTIVTCGIWGIIWAYKIGKAEANYAGKDNSVIYLLLTIFGLSIVVYCLAQNNINQYAVSHSGQAPAATA